MSLAGYLNQLDEAAARTALTRCCSSEAWVRDMLARRPFADDDTLAVAVDAAWNGLPPLEWLAAIAAHPPIGAQRESVSPWSREEQAGMETASAGVTARMAELNRIYQERFGHVFLICATGRTAEEMLAELERRLVNDPHTELEEAANELRRIIHIRLHKLVTA